jgi:hypothetical protein
MPKDKDRKRLVRARMQKTGESYTTARERVSKRARAAQEETREQALSASPSADAVDHATLAGMNDAAVAAKTQRTWKEWVEVLDAAGAAALSHRDTAALLRSEHGLTGWWSQTVTVGYERIRGLRDKGQQRADGTYRMGKSKTLPVPIDVLYAAFDSRERKRWLGEGVLVVRKATRCKSMRCTADDGSRVDVYFWEKGQAKSLVHIEQPKLPSKTRAEELRTLWTRRLAALATFLAATGENDSATTSPARRPRA